MNWLGVPHLVVDLVREALGGVYGFGGGFDWRLLQASLNVAGELSARRTNSISVPE
ncbi:Uncharacterised protein [Mycobacteroides abscessus subsp. abscessus]|uniref:hypothetical protein n=1 Tax=Mycobacteroides abscessus TaxID=36809 RepID=UPI0009261D4F|nr:hypothetical protein [Mycobacteroides abscessus]SIH38965.1 Uncharacterised protein [Mycobacteroides abscessus subsp. abscessus]